MKNGKIFNIKDEGLVLDVYKEIREPETFMGNSAIGHTRYTTAGDKKKYLSLIHISKQRNMKKSSDTT